MYFPAWSAFSARPHPCIYFYSRIKMNPLSLGTFILSFGDRLNPSWKPLMSGAVSLALSASMPSFSQSICSFISLSFLPNWQWQSLLCHLSQTRLPECHCVLSSLDCRIPNSPSCGCLLCRMHPTPSRVVRGRIPSVRVRSSRTACPGKDCRHPATFRSSCRRGYPIRLSASIPVTFRI